MNLCDCGACCNTCGHDPGCSSRQATDDDGRGYDDTYDDYRAA